MLLYNQILLKKSWILFISTRIIDPQSTGQTIFKKPTFEQINYRENLLVQSIVTAVFKFQTKQTKQTIIWQLFINVDVVTHYMVW